jgi:hypothetical protein
VGILGRIMGPGCAEAADTGPRCPIPTPPQTCLRSSKPSWADQVEEEGEDGECVYAVAPDRLVTAPAESPLPAPGHPPGANLLPTPLSSFQVPVPGGSGNSLVPAFVLAPGWLCGLSPSFMRGVFPLLSLLEATTPVLCP